MSVQATLKSSDLTVVVSARGAELQSILDGTGHEWLWQGGALWPQRAPLLFPVIGTPGGGQIHWQGKAYSMPIHGFVSDADFQMGQVGQGEASFALRSSDRTRAMFPFEFELATRYAVDRSVLTQSVVIRNPSDTPVPLQFGLHPGFRLPREAPGQPVVVFEKPEGSTIRMLQTGQLYQAEPSPLRDRALDLQGSTFDTGGILFAEVQSRRVWLGNRGGRGLTFSFDGFPSLALWTKSTADYLCLEPWRGIPDTPDYRGDFGERAGTLFLAPGQDASFQCRIEFGTTE